MNEWAPLVTAVLGGSGLTALLAGFAPLRRSHRLRSRLEEIDAATKIVASGTPESRALEVARTKTALEIAALTLNRGPMARWGVAYFSIWGLGLAAYLEIRSLAGATLDDLAILPTNPVQTVVSLMVVLFSACLSMTAIYRSSARRNARFILTLAKKPWNEDRVLRRSLLLPTIRFVDGFSKEKMQRLRIGEERSSEERSGTAQHAEGSTLSTTDAADSTSVAP